MPAKSKAQRRLFAAAEHGAHFAKAQALRQSLTHAQLKEFATTPEKSLPAHATSYRARLNAKRGV